MTEVASAEKEGSASLLSRYETPTELVAKLELNMICFDLRQEAKAQ